MDNQFLRTQMLLGGDAMNQLHCSHVAVFGLGGVGSYAVEALVRSGVGELTLIDDDTVSPTNLNRWAEQGGGHRRALPRHQPRCQTAPLLCALRRRAPRGLLHRAL